MVGRCPELHHSKDACIKMKGNPVKEVLAEAGGLDLPRMSQEAARRGLVGSSKERAHGAAIMLVTCPCVGAVRTRITSSSCFVTCLLWDLRKVPQPL